MQAIVYRRAGGSTTPALEERPVPTPGPGELRVRIQVSGVNPVDAKNRSRPDDLVYVPGHDGAGVVDAVGAGVAPERVGERVWVWAAGWQRTEGTAQEYVTLPSSLAIGLPASVSFEEGAGLGVPALTAHRCLTLGEGFPARLAPGALAGRAVLVAGGAGAVGNAAIQLARWAGATVVATVSSPEKGALASAAGAHHVVNYRSSDAADSIRSVFPSGVELVVEVNAAANQALDRSVLAVGGTVAFYAGADGDELSLPVRELMTANQRWHGVFLFSVPVAANSSAVEAVSAAVADRALRPGPEAGLPFIAFGLSELMQAYDAVLDPGVTGKPLVTVP